jgi:hypothetical protein
MNKFFFADENPSFSSFFLIAARRAAILFPLAGVLSISAVDVVKLFILVFWILAGDWGERIKTCKRNPLMLILVLLIFWTFIGVIRWVFIEPDMVLAAARHWWSRYSFLCLFILATLYSDKGTRVKALAVFNFAIVLFCVNVILVWNGVWTADRPSCFLFFNSITTGVVLVMWSLYWIYYSFQSRNIPIVRRVLPVSILLGMKVAARTTPFELLLGLNFFNRATRLPIWGIIFSLIRWGIVALSCYFVYAVNPSRTAQLIMAIIIVSGILMWNWRRGIIILVVILLPCIFAMATSNDVFFKKWQRTYTGVNHLLTKDVDEISAVSKDRDWIFSKIAPEIMKKPIAGYGVDVDFKRTRGLLQYGKTPKQAQIHTHSDYTQLAMQSGLVGLGIFVLLLAMAFFYSTKMPYPMNCFAALMIIIMCIDMAFNVPIYFCRHKFVVMFTMAIVFAEILYFRRNV